MLSQTRIFPLFGLTIALLSPSFAAEEAAPALKPNIIYILADDLGYGDLSFLGQEKFATPHIDQLAAKGMFFSEHYSGSSVCAPSRACLLSGKHSGRAYIRGNREINPEGQEPIPAEIELLPEMLREAGYVSGAFGKWGLGFPGSEGDPLNQGFDEFYGYNCQRLGHHYYPYHLWDGKEKVMLEENAGEAKVVYAPNLIHDRTLAFIEKHKDQPFFCYVASIIPHADLDAPEEYMEKFRGKFPPGKPYKGVDKGPNLRNGPYQSQDEPRVAFAAMITLLDDQVGEIVAKTEELGIADNTLIIFTSDNGAHEEGGADPDFFDSNGIFRGHKRDLYEGGVHVPMVAYWPGHIAAGTESKQISAFWDMVPTFTELAGLEAPEDIDGISIVPTLIGKGEQRDHSYLYWEFHERGGRIAVRKGKWKAVKYNHGKNANSPVELYDLSKDKSETTDVSAEFPEIVQELVKCMKEAHEESEVFPFRAP
ncbi:MAG: arylsulfatase [Luteolibacter sp.]